MYNDAANWNDSASSIDVKKLFLRLYYKALQLIKGTYLNYHVNF